MASKKHRPKMAQPAAFLGGRDPLTGQSLIMTEQDDRAYQNFCKAYFDEFLPKTHSEKQLVRTIADTQWRLNRARAIECNLLTYDLSQKPDKCSSNETEAHTAFTQASTVKTLTLELSRMSMYEQRLHRVLESSMDRLTQVQKERRANELQALEVAAAIRKLKQSQREPWTPSDDGFDVTISDIDSHVRRTNLLKQAAYTARQ